MALRIVGFLVLLLGTALIGLAIWALVTVDQDAAQLASATAVRGEAFDSVNWSQHWRNYSVLIAVMGAFITFAGGALFARRSSGLLLASGAAALAAVGPWFYEVFGLASYGYEQAGAGESAALLAVALAFLLWHFSSRRRSQIGT